jgi:hypothetical protein
MKDYPSPIAYPTTKQESHLWGFDIVKPTGVPKAYIVDWSSPGPGFGVSDERALEVANYKVDVDLSKLSVDELFAGLSFAFRTVLNGIFHLTEEEYGTEKARELATKVGNMMGTNGWTSVKEQFGLPAPYDKIAWYQDVAHLVLGTCMRVRTWYDDKKTVATRTDCGFRPLAGSSGDYYCKYMDVAYGTSYMKIDPTLLIARIYGPEEDGRGRGPRCISMWSYDPQEFTNLPEKVKKAIDPKYKEILRQRGAKV